MNALIRANRKGGAVAHLLRTVDAPSVCGRVMAFVPGGEGLRLCKTCARITGVAMDIDTRAFPEIPELSTLPALAPEWAAIERAWLRTVDSFTMGNARDVLTQYMDNPSEYDMTNAHTVRLLAKYRAYLKLHTGADFLDPTDTVAPSKDNGNRNGGMVNPNSKSVAKSKGANANQRAGLLNQAAFIDSLFSQLFEIQGKDVKEDEKDYAVKSYTDEAFDKMTRADIDKQFNGNSALIDRLKLEIEEAKQEARKNAPATVKAPAADEGYFIYGDTFLCVKSNRAGTGQYATVWSHDSESWEYDRGQSYKLMRDAREGKFPRVTPEAAASFGELYGRCMRCSRKLTDANSIAEAMGKVCAGKMGF